MNKPRYFMDPDDGEVYNLFYWESDPPAVYTEEVQVVPLDAIVIRRDELPEVEIDEVSGIRADAPGSDGTWIRPEVYGDPVAVAEARVREYLALAAYLRKHPPVDEEQVDGIIAALRKEGRYDPGTDLRTIARDLYSAGIRAVTSDG